MAQKMVTSFRRSISFSNQTSSKPKKNLHVRSTSLPCRSHSHPLISQLKDKINGLKTWGSNPSSNQISSWLCDGLNRLRTVHEGLDDLLQLPQTRQTLRGHSELIENLVEDFLRFVDVFGIFQTLVLTLKQESIAAQVAIRRRDDSKIVFYVKSLKKICKEISKLISIVRCMKKCDVSAQAVSLSNGDPELAEVMRNVNEVTVLVSEAFFNEISRWLGSHKPSWMGLRLSKKAEEGIQEFQLLGLESLWGLRKKSEEEVKMVLKRMNDLDGCIFEIENGSERVFRILINSRVSLLNVLNYSVVGV